MDLVARFVPVTLIIAFLATNALPWADASSSTSCVAEAEFTPMDSIYILGNDDFTAENGVVSGTGSSSDPYIIEGWEMNFNNTGTGITVVEADRYFVVRNVHITGAKIGMRFEGVYHARVTGTTIDNCTTGISASYSEASKVDNVVISDCSVGVSLRYCDAFKLSDITYVNNDEDLRVIALPWIQTRQADLVYGVVAGLLVSFVALLLYFRYKSLRPPEEKP